MRIFRYSSFCLLLLILLIPNAFGSGFAYDGLGVKARGMGGAFRAVADDWSAAFYNPAGYTQIPDNWVAGNWDFFHNRFTAIPNVTRDGYETGYYNGQELYNTHAINDVPQGGILARLPVWGETVFGFGIMQAFDQNHSWELYGNIPAYNQRDYPNKQFFNNLDAVNFQLTAAREFMEEKLSVGIGLSVVRGDLVYHDVVLRDNPFRDDSLFGEIAVRPYDIIPEWYANDGDGWGFGYKVGLLYHLNEKMRLGLVYNGKSSVDISGETAFRFYMADNATMAATLEGRGILQTDEEFYFVSGEVEEVTADFETTLDVPASIGAGLAYQVNEKFLVAIDGEYIFWSQFEGFKFSFDNYADLPKDDFTRAHDLIKTNLSIPINWDDAGRVMIGMSYQLKDFVQLRGGFNFSQTVVNDDTFIPQFMDLADRVSVSLGLGFNVQNWRLEWAGVYTHQGTVTVGSASDVDGDGLTDNVTGEYSGDIYRTLLGLSYRF